MEGMVVAHQVIDELESRGFSVVPWFDFFHSTRPPLQELEHITLQVHAAVLVATSDDPVVLRDQQLRQMRDNVLFEYGLFAGAIGRAKCSLLVPNLERFRIPSDFLGVACFERYDVDSTRDGVVAVASALSRVLARAPHDEAAQSRGRRLLGVLGWIRDESFRLLQEWDNEAGPLLISDRIIAVSSFIKQDIDDLDLRAPYDGVVARLLEAIDAFPQATRLQHPASLGYQLAEALPHIRPDREFYRAALAELERKGVAVHVRGCERCEHRWRYLDEGRWLPPWWPEDRYPWRLDHCERCCGGPFAWAAGAASVVTAVRDHMDRGDPLREVRRWSHERLPPLNEAIQTLERKLHEAVFGPL